MRILLTGPSCAGKTCMSEQFSSALIVHLDEAEGERFRPESGQEGRQPGLVIYEGMPSGSNSAVKKFLGEMDAVLLLEPAASVRLLRCWRRDGWRHIFRWLYNEWCWRVFCRPLIKEHHNVRRIRWEASSKSEYAAHTVEAGDFLG